MLSEGGRTYRELWSRARRSSECLRRRGRVSASQAEVADAPCARVAHHLRGKLQLHPRLPARGKQLPGVCGARRPPARPAAA
jgi:hypothetical protein